MTQILAKKQPKTINTHKQKTKHRIQSTEPLRKNTKEAKTAKKHTTRRRQADTNLQTSTRGGNEQVCGSNTIMQTAKTLQNLVQAGEYI